VTLNVLSGASSLELPLRPQAATDAKLKQFEPADNAPALNATRLRPGEAQYRITQDVSTGERVLHILGDDGLLHNNDTDWSFGSSCQRQFSILPDDPLSATANIIWRKEYARGDWKVSILAEAQMSMSKQHYLIKAKLEAFENDDKIFSNQWDCEIPRDHN
jgi:hypothetical protein